MPDDQNVPYNITTFEATDQFLRRIPPLLLKKDGKISSAAFHNDRDSDRMSVNWLKLSSVEHTLSGFSGWGVASIFAQLCYSLQQEPVYSPTVDNCAHCDIVGHKTESISKKLRDGAHILRHPGD